MFVIDQRTKEEQDRRNHEGRAAWMNNVIWIFWGFLAVFVGMRLSSQPPVSYSSDSFSRKSAIQIRRLGEPSSIH
jgi:hypothetical protein